MNVRKGFTAAACFILQRNREFGRIDYEKKQFLGTGIKAIGGSGDLVGVGAMDKAFGRQGLGPIR